jgi:hypothetical protein
MGKRILSLLLLVVVVSGTVLTPFVLTAPKAKATVDGPTFSEISEAVQPFGDETVQLQTLLGAPVNSVKVNELANYLNNNWNSGNDCKTIYDIIGGQVTYVDSAWRKDNGGGYLGELRTAYTATTPEEVNQAIANTLEPARKIKVVLYAIALLNQKYDAIKSRCSEQYNVNWDKNNGAQIWRPGKIADVIESNGDLNNGNLYYPTFENFWSDFKQLDTFLETYRQHPVQENDPQNNVHTFDGALHSVLESIQGNANAKADFGDIDPCGSSGGIFKPTILVSYMFCGLAVNVRRLVMSILFSATALLANQGDMLPRGTDTTITSQESETPLFNTNTNSDALKDFIIPIEQVVVNTSPNSLGLLVNTAYQRVLELVNFALIVAFLFIAFANILQIQINTYAIKKILPGLLIGFFVAHFSMLLMRASLEMVGVLTRGLMAVGDESSRASMQNLYKAFTSFPYTMQEITGNCDPNTTPYMTLLCSVDNMVDITKVFKLLVSSVFILIPAVLVLILGFLLILRRIIFFAVLPLAPLAFATMFVPPAASIWGRWWKLVSGWLFMPIVSGFWLWLGLMWMNTTPAQNAGVIVRIFSYTLGILSVYLAMKTPFSMAGEAKGLMDKWSKAGKSAFKATGLPAAGIAVGVGAKRLGGTIGMNALDAARIGNVYRGAKQWGSTSAENYKRRAEAFTKGPIDQSKEKKIMRQQRSLEALEKATEVKKENADKVAKLKAELQDGSLSAEERAKKQKELDRQIKIQQRYDRNFERIYGSDDDMRKRKQAIQDSIQEMQSGTSLSQKFERFNDARGESAKSRHDRIMYGSEREKAAAIDDNPEIARNRAALDHLKETTGALDNIMKEEIRARKAALLDADKQYKGLYFRAQEGKLHADLKTQENEMHLARDWWSERVGKSDELKSEYVKALTAPMAAKKFEDNALQQAFLESMVNDHAPHQSLQKLFKEIKAMPDGAIVEGVQRHRLMANLQKLAENKDRPDPVAAQLLQSLSSMNTLTRDYVVNNVAKDYESSPTAEFNKDEFNKMTFTRIRNESNRRSSDDKKISLDGGDFVEESIEKGSLLRVAAGEGLNDKNQLSAYMALGEAMGRGGGAMLPHQYTKLAKYAEEVHKIAKIPLPVDDGTPAVKERIKEIERARLASDRIHKEIDPLNILPRSLELMSTVGDRQQATAFKNLSGLVDMGALGLTQGPSNNANRLIDYIPNTEGMDLTREKFLANLASSLSTPSKTVTVADLKQMLTSNNPAERDAIIKSALTMTGNKRGRTP